MSTYLFEHTWEQGRRRLDLLEQVFDPGTFDHLARLPLAAGSRCLEVGAGAGSVARWLCGRVGPGGRVVATDLDTEFLETLTEANLERYYGARVRVIHEEGGLVVVPQRHRERSE